MAVTIQLPPEIEERLKAQSKDLSAELREAAALELFRQGKLSHHELSQVLGVDRFETDAYLKRHNVYEGSLTMEDLEADRQTLEEVLGQVKKA
jgi:predicted HTH domain antitoxin